MNKKTIAASFIAISSMLLAACNNTSTTDTPQKTAAQKAYDDCDKWVENKKDKSAECKDHSSSHYGGYLFGNHYYNSSNALHSSSSYKSNVKHGVLKKTSPFKKASFKPAAVKSTSTPKASGFKSGIGSGGARGGS